MKYPQYDREAMRIRTRENPYWIHFGAGNIFRAFQANVVQDLLNEGILDRGIIVAEGYDEELIEKVYRPFDDVHILVTLKADGSAEKTEVGSVAESLVLDADRAAEFTRLQEIFEKDSLQMASFTITEKGYSLRDGKGELLPTVKEDFNNGPKKPISYMGKVVSLLYARFRANQKPIAMVSMDNCSHNGTKLAETVFSFAEEWVKNGLVEQAFLEYVSNPAKVSYPWTMIDKITPRPDPDIEALLQADGIENMSPIITSQNTYAAPFVNAEESQYLVIEDVFPNGRPGLEKGGVLFADKETVDRTEKMKVCTCLNPLHTALAVFGCLLGFTRISEEMKDKTLVKLVEQIGYIEGLPVVVNPGILNPKEFIDTVLKVRIPNPFMPDTPQRITTDTSQKLPIRFGETIKAYVRTEGLKVSDLKCIPLVFAGWLRYLMAADDEGQVFTPSPDPMLTELMPMLSKVSLGQKMDMAEAEALLKPILSNEKIWGVNLYEVQMDKIVCQYFTEMIRETGAVRRTLEKYV